MSGFFRRLLGIDGPGARAEPATPLCDDTWPRADTARSEPPVVPIAESKFGSLPPGDAVGPGASPSLAWRIGQRVLDEFIVESSIDTGGMGMVYRVRSESTGQAFAAKRARLRTAELLRAFLMEIQTWIDLPEHPHLAACRFFRTVGEEAVVFSEYVEGGTLGDWICSRKLTFLEGILDVAIQLAWALDALHRLGLVHQDIKPHNVLMTADGTVKLADFGLARAQTATLSAPALGNEPPGATFRGMTPAYCSPEQAKINQELRRGIPPRQLGRLTEQTDIWSFGLCVLEMFAGRRTWDDGTEAPRVFEQLLHESDLASLSPPRISDGVAVILRRCFDDDPVKRPETMAGVAEALCQAYCQSIGRQYPRSQPVLPMQLGLGPEEFRRFTLTGARYPHPAVWLHVALREAGRDMAELKALESRPSRSRRGAVAADLALFHEARQTFEALAAQGRTDLESLLAECCSAEAIVREHSDDLPGALRLFDQAMLLFERAFARQPQDYLSVELGEVCMNKAAALAHTGDLTAAARLYDRAIVTFETLARQGDNVEYVQHLAIASLSKGVVIRRQGDLREALVLYDRTIHLLSGLLARDRRIEVAVHLGKALMNKGIALKHWRNVDAAKQATTEAIQVFEQLVTKYQRVELAEMLACAHENLGVILHEAKDYQTALPCLDKALAIRERLVNEAGLWELADKLAGTFGNKANTVGRLDRRDEAIALQQRAIAIREKLVREYGRLDVEDDLARSYLNLAVDFQHLGDHHGALELLDRTIAIRERAAQKNPVLQVRVGLGNAYLDKANSLRDTGQKDAAIALYDRCIALWTALIESEGHAELQESLAVTLLNKLMAVENLTEAEAKALVTQVQASQPRSDVPVIPVTARDDDVEAHRHSELAACLGEKGNYMGAISHCDKAIAAFEQLRQGGGRPDLVTALAQTYCNKGINLSCMENLPAAAEQLDRGIAFGEQAVEFEPKWENRVILAKAYMNKAVVLAKQAEFAAAVALYDRAIGMLDRVVFPEGHRDWLSTLGRCRAGQSQCIFHLGRREEAVAKLRETMGLLEAELARSRRRDLQEVLNWAKQVLEDMRRSQSST